MIRKKRKVYRKKSLRYFKPAIVLAGGATGASLISSAMPVGTGGALSAAGTGMASFVGPAAMVGGALFTLNQLRKLPQPKRKRKHRRL